MDSQENIVFYSCLINNRDDAKPMLFQDGFKRILFTDNPSLSAPDWQIREPVKVFHDPVRTSRYHKLHPFEIFPDAEYAIWLDMTHTPYQSLRPLISNNDLTLHLHCQRTSVSQEVRACQTYKKDSPFILNSQISYYLKEGFPDNIGLYSTSCLIMKNTYKFKLLSELWWNEICHWSKRDQISLPYCLWRLNMKPNIISGLERNGFSPYFKFKSHN